MIFTANYVIVVFNLMVIPKWYDINTKHKFSYFSQETTYRFLTNAEISVDEPKVMGLTL